MGTITIPQYRAGDWRKAIKRSDLSGADTQTLYTVTGTVEAVIYGQCITAPTGDNTIEVGVAGNTAGLIAQIANSGTLAQHEIYWDATPTTTLEQQAATAQQSRPFVITNGQDIIQTKNAAVNAGVIDYYCYWRPVSADGYVAPA